MIEKSGFLHDPIDPGFAGKVHWSLAVLAAAPEDSTMPAQREPSS
jgi:hypothetical protein